MLHLEQHSVSSEEKQTKAETKPALLDANVMERWFTTFMEKMRSLLKTPSADLDSTGESATDTSISKCKAYLHLIDFPQEEMDKISDPQSLFELLMPYLNFQRFHVLEMIIGQFRSDKATSIIQKYHGRLDTYQSQVKLGKFVLDMVTPPINPPFMRPFGLQLESKWATCTVQDLQKLLVQILPKSIGNTFVWFCKASQVPSDNSICLDYVVSPSVVEMLKEEAERKQPILKSAGILMLSVNGTDIKPKVG